MTTIGLSANDQLLAVTLNPKLASGQQNTVDIHVDFSDDWDGFAKSAVFFTSNDTNTIYEKVLTNGECVIPAEVMSKDGVLYIGVRGVNSQNNEVKTTSLVKYKISEGSPSGAGTEVEPTPNVYQQLLSAYGKTDNSINKEISDRKSAIATEKAERQTEIAVERARITNLATLSEGSTTGDAELTDARVGYDGTVYGSVGDAIRSQATGIDPTRMCLSYYDLWMAGLTVKTSFKGNTYYLLTEEGQEPTEVTPTPGLGMITFPCFSGEKYLIHCIDHPTDFGIMEVRRSITPLTGDFTCAIGKSEIANYVEEYDPENNIYLLTIPDNAANIYIIIDGQIGLYPSIEIKKAFGKYNIDWLELKKSNFPDKCVPLSALQENSERLIYDNTLTEPVSSILITNDMDGNVFSVKNITIYVTIPASPNLNALGYLAFQLTLDYQSVKTTLSTNITRIAGGTEGSNHRVMLKLTAEDDRWNCISATKTNQKSSLYLLKATPDMMGFIGVYSKIPYYSAKGIYLGCSTSGSELPTGTRIEVYGK